MSASVIEIRRNGDGFEVAVVPSDPDHPPVHFDAKKDAFGHIGGVRLVTGWPKIDLTES